MVLNAFHREMILKKTENQDKKIEKNISKLVALMDHLTVKSLRLVSVNSILDELNRQCEAVLILHNTLLPGQQADKVKVILQSKKLNAICVVLMFLLLTLNIFHTLSNVSIVDFEKANVDWERHYKSYQVGWLHDELTNYFMLRLTKYFTDTVY